MNDRNSREADSQLAALRERARTVASAHEAALDAERDETRAARRALAALAEADLLGITVPCAFGGADLSALIEAHEVSARALCAVRSELAYRSGMLDVMFVMQGLGSYPIARAGNERMRLALLTEVARGRSVAAFALTESGAGSDLASIALRAEPSGAKWRLSGAKTFISNAGLADFYCVLARTSGSIGDAKGALGMFRVPANARGVSVERFEVLAPHPIGEVRFAGVEVDDEERLGAVGDGLDLALATLARFRTSVAAAANGFARRALDESIAYVRSRTQFGRTLAEQQGVRFDLAEMDAKLRAAELLVDEAARAVDRGERATAEIARAKWFATETAGWICDRAVQLHGGLGVKKGSVVEHLFRDVRALRIYEGTSEMQKLILARELVDGAADARTQSPARR